jgi:hypothetical protein
VLSPRINVLLTQLGDDCRKGERMRSLRCREIITRFLSDVLLGKPEQLYFLLWSKPDMKSAWFRDVDAAAEYAASRPGCDLYAGGGLSGEDLGPHRRVRADEVLGVVGLWADIDVAGPHHQSAKRYPPTRTAALTVLERVPLRPTLIVDSGHGLQAWWLFQEPYFFEGGEERMETAAVARAWDQTIAAHARHFGWDVDPVGDLARVLRVAGTYNHKGDAAVPVTLLDAEGPRYAGPSDFEPFLLSPVGEDGSRTSAAVPHNGELVLAPDADPPGQKFRKLLRKSPKFCASWERTRDDLRDGSASGYDMSLAWIAAAQDWSDQEIVDLLIAWRREHGEQPKLRGDYFRKTIARARAAVAAARSLRRSGRRLRGRSSSSSRRRVCPVPSSSPSSHTL